VKVLVACEYSGRVRDAFIRNGHDAISCDLLPSESDFGPHYQGDVWDLIEHEYFDLMIAHPPCTYLTNSGVCHLHKDPDRWAKLDEGAQFFRDLLLCDIPKKCIENPIMHKYARERVGRNKTQVIQPWMFGHMEQKATCLWLEGLPPLKPTNVVKAEMMKLPKHERERLHYCSPGPDRWRIRSRTFEGIAQAMADQWDAA
jgi:hypothetical protein